MAVWNSSIPSLKKFLLRCAKSDFGFRPRHKRRCLQEVTELPNALAVLLHPLTSAIIPTREGSGIGGPYESRVSGLGPAPFSFSTGIKKHLHKPAERKASSMGTLQPANENGVIPMRRDSVENLPPVLDMPTVLVATVDPEIKESMRRLLDLYPLNTVWAKSVDEVRVALAKENVSACFCGFWLIDGTYRDVVRHLKKHPIEIPAVVVCAPACPNEYRDYLAALNIRAFDFICHPYRKTDMERILQAAFSLRHASEQIQTSPLNAALAADGESNLRKAG